MDRARILRAGVVACVALATHAGAVVAQPVDDPTCAAAASAEVHQQRAEADMGGGPRLPMWAAARMEKVVAKALSRAGVRCKRARP